MAASTTAAKPNKRNSEPLAIGPGGAWRKRAPRGVWQGYLAGSEHGWIAWRRHLAERKFRPLAKLFGSGRSPLLWATPMPEPSRAAELIQLLSPATASARRRAAIEDRALAWLAAGGQAAAGNGLFGAREPAVDAALALECLAWCWALPKLAAWLDEKPWWDMTNRLASLAAFEGSPPAEASSPAHDPLTTLMLHGELPLALAYAFPELTICCELAAAGRRTLSEAMAALTGGHGLLHCHYLPILRPLLACWTRTRTVAQALGGAGWDEHARDQYATIVQYALRLSRPDGRQVFSSVDSPRLPHALLASARRLTAKDRQTERIVRLTAQGTSARQLRGTGSPSPSFDSEWAGTAVLHSSWARSAPRLSVAYGGRQVFTELGLGGRQLWSGAWDLEVRWNGQPRGGHSEWEQVCWESDDDVDYLELEAHLSDEILVERHMLLARADRFLLLADAITAIQEGAIEYRATLPLAGHSQFDGARETREGSLVAGGRPLARVLPLALGEWRAQRSRGSLRATVEGLELTQSAEGQALFAPLFIDLDAGRSRRETTWRQLTVAQQRQIMPADVAVGYRAQVGKSQWLIYRSLSLPAIRTVLGTNLMHEFLVARFEADGQIKKLLEIE